MAAAIVFSIPHLKAKILYEFRGIQSPLVGTLGGARYVRAATSDNGSTFTARHLARAQREHRGWVAWQWMHGTRPCAGACPLAGFAFTGIARARTDCADHPFWAEPFPIPQEGAREMAQLQSRLRADSSDVLLEEFWCAIVQRRSFRVYGGRASRSLGRLRPRAWGPCGIDLSVSMSRQTLLSIASAECSPDEQPDPWSTQREIVRHILAH
jgi:hypothetical protein